MSGMWLEKNRDRGCGRRHRFTVIRWGICKWAVTAAMQHLFNAENYCYLIELKILSTGLQHRKL